MEKNTVVYQNVQALCKKKGVSIRALEKELGFGKCTIARWARVNPRIDNIILVADYFQVPVDLLVCGDVSVPLSGKLVVMNADEEICGLCFSGVAEMVRQIRLLSSKKRAEVSIRLFEVSGDGARI